MMYRKKGQRILQASVARGRGVQQSSTSGGYEKSTTSLPNLITVCPKDQHIFDVTGSIIGWLQLSKISI